MEREVVKIENSHASAYWDVHRQKWRNRPRAHNREAVKQFARIGLWSEARCRQLRMQIRKGIAVESARKELLMLAAPDLYSRANGGVV